MHASSTCEVVNWHPDERIMKAFFHCLSLRSHDTPDCLLLSCFHTWSDVRGTLSSIDKGLEAVQWTLPAQLQWCHLYHFQWRVSVLHCNCCCRAFVHSAGHVGLLWTCTLIHECVKRGELSRDTFTIYHVYFELCAHFQVCSLHHIKLSQRVERSKNVMLADEQKPLELSRHQVWLHCVTVPGHSMFISVEVELQKISVGAALLW